MPALLNNLGGYDEVSGGMDVGESWLILLQGHGVGYLKHDMM